MPCGITCKKIGRHCHAAHCVDETTCVAVTLSDPANRLLKRTDSEGSSSAAEKKSSAVPPISQRSHVGNLRQTIQGKGVTHKRVETAGVYPLVRPARRQRKISARFASDTLPFCTRTQKRNTADFAVSLFAHITGFCFPDFSAVPHGGALLRSPEALSPALQRTRVSPGRCAYARDSRSYPRTDRAFSADD